MRSLAVVVTILCLTPLWAEDLDSVPVKLGFDWEDELIRGRFTNGFFTCEVEQNLETRFTDRCVFTWSAYGEDPDYPIHWVFAAVPPMWESEISQYFGHLPKRPDEYHIGVQYCNSKWDIRGLWPIARVISGHRTEPYVELRRWEFATINDRITLLARGRWNPDHVEYAAGAEFKLPWGLSAQALYGSDNFTWSVSFETTINR